jgi:hypothetical protein
LGISLRKLGLGTLLKSSSGGVEELHLQFFIEHGWDYFVESNGIIESDTFIYTVDSRK